MLKKTAHAQSNRSNPLTGPDAEHFFTCPHCMQMVDRRDFGAVLLHESPTHRFKHGDRRREMGEEGDAQHSLQPLSESAQKSVEQPQKRVPFTPAPAAPSQRVPFTPAPVQQEQRVQPFTPPKPRPQVAPPPAARAPKPAAPSAAPAPKPQARVEPERKASAPPQQPVATPKPQPRVAPAPSASAPNPQPVQKPVATSRPQPRVEPAPKVSAPLPPAAPMPQPQARATPQPQLHSEPLSEASVAGLLPEQPFAQPEPHPVQTEPRPSLNFLRAHDRGAAHEMAPPRAPIAAESSPPQEEPPASAAASPPPPVIAQAEEPRPKPAAPDLSRFERCLECGGMIDGKELGQVAYHSRLGHAPKSDPNFERLRGRALTAMAEDRIR